MSLEEHNSIPDVSRASLSDTALPGASSQQDRQFKHFIVTADDERFNPNKKRIKRNRVRVACSWVPSILYVLYLLIYL